MTSNKALMQARGKYAELIDAETWAYIEKSNAAYPDNAVELSYAEQRHVYNDMCEQFRVPHPPDVASSDSYISTETHEIPIRQYCFQHGKTSPAPKAQILYFHGGGFLVGGLESHDDVCAELCASTGFALTSVDYRLAPEHIFPAAYEDAVAAYGYLTKTSALPIILAGDSAGGNLAASLAFATKQASVKPIGQVLIYPALTHDLSSNSYSEHANAPHLTTADVKFYRELVTGGTDRSQDPRCAPLADTDFSGLPATHVFGAACDPLLDDGRAYCEKINAAGGNAHFTEEAGLVHGYLRARHSVKRARDSFQRMAQALSSLAQLS